MTEEDSPPVAESVADAERVQDVKKDEKEEIDGEQIDSDVGEGEPDSKKAGESAKMAEEDSPPVVESEAPEARVMADTETVQAVKKDKKDEIDGEQIDNDENAGEPDSKKA